MELSTGTVLFGEAAPLIAHLNIYKTVPGGINVGNSYNLPLRQHRCRPPAYEFIDAGVVINAVDSFGTPFCEAFPGDGGVA